MAQNSKKNFSLTRWIIILILIVLNIIMIFLPDNLSMIMAICAMITAVFAFAHGYQRYGIKNMIIFFLITWIVSNFFESLSIAVGFPFGDYYYTMPGPRIVNVPIVIMPAYFGMGYLSWTLSNALLNQYGKKLSGIWIFLVPLITAFIMVMWDLVFDPNASTINQNWIWENEGVYFGVPISNYFGWFLVVYLFAQIFALYISKFDQVSHPDKMNKIYWLEPSIVYGLQGISLVIPAVVIQENVETNASMALVTVFTMIFVAILSGIHTLSSNNLAKVTTANL